MGTPRYKAFISYSHKDEDWASWLHGQLESFEPPEELDVSERLTPIFQDREELAVSTDLGKTIQDALAASENLIVVCSPAAVASTWVRKEIEFFQQLGRGQHIFCLVVDGKPNDPNAECLPEPLRKHEPLAADVRTEGHARSHSVLRLIAALLNVSFNDLRRRESSIAVLPFRNLSAAADTEYLCDGFAEELISKLTEVRSLRVIARNSSFQFRDSSESTGDIARKLDATFIADGSIRTMGNVFRVAVQLIDGRTNNTRWSHSYQGSLEQLFDLQDNIAADLASELNRTLKPTAAAEKHISGEARQLLLRARHLTGQFTKEALARSNELLEEAIALEPDYVDAWNALSVNLSTQVGDGFAPASALQQAKHAITTVLRIDPDNAEAQSGLGWIALRFDNDLNAAARHLQVALDSGARNNSVLNSVGGFLLRARRSTDAIAVAKRIAELDPLSSFAQANLGVYTLFAGQYDNAIRAYRHALEISPGFTGGHYSIGLAQLKKREPEAAMESFSKETDEAFRCKGQAFAFFDLDDRPAFQQKLEHFTTNWGASWPDEVAEMYAYAGMVDEAFEWLLKGAEDSNGSGLAEAVLNPVYEKLHDDVRWHQYLDKYQLTPAQLENIEFSLPDDLMPERAL